MEVHKHPHHVTHKKKWTEYLLEFIMLFLAVFLGFFVENFREHKVELERIEKHMQTMVENLQYDTTRFGSNLRANLSIADGLDSLRYQVDEAIHGKVDANKLYYYYWRYGRGSSFPIITDAAITQLKSSGMLRMIRNGALVTEMGDYYGRRIITLETSREGLGKRRDQLNETYKLFFDFHGFDEILQRDTVFISGKPSVFHANYYAAILKRDPPLKLMPSAMGNFERLYNDIAAYELQLRLVNSFIRYCNDGADSLMKHIEEEYKFEK